MDELAPSKVTFQMKTNGNLVVSVKGSDDTFIIKNFSSGLYIFEFANGVTGTVHAVTGEFTEIMSDFMVLLLCLINKQQMDAVLETTKGKGIVWQH